MNADFFRARTLSKRLYNYHLKMRMKLTALRAALTLALSHWRGTRLPITDKALRVLKNSEGLPIF